MLGIPSCSWYWSLVVFAFNAHLCSFASALHTTMPCCLPCLSKHPMYVTKKKKHRTQIARNQADNCTPAPLTLSEERNRTPRAPGRHSCKKSPSTPHCNLPPISQKRHHLRQHPKLRVPQNPCRQFRKHAPTPDTSPPPPKQHLHQHPKLHAA